MSSTDNRIVQMKFENDQFERGAKQTLDTLSDLKKGLDLEGAAKGLDGIGDAAKGMELSGIAAGVEQISSRFSALGIIGVTALQNITNSAINAGKRIISALTIDPVTTGFDEYELKMGSIQTIMAGTGEDLETVNQYLAELNEYSDKTIYSFADMTQNIGKFTNAGVKLEDAVNAIKGISNAAAVSGANAEEASRAMYNFSQALSAGYVKLIDWKSIENANMATVEFKTQLIEAAVAAGTVTEAGNGMYKTLSGNLFNATKGFNEVLQDQWMTTEVLVGTLNEYSDETTDIGKKAMAAAQDIKTFSQLYDTLKEAAQSGWATSWELIVGDFEEAKAMLTDVSNVVGGFIDASADARNAVIKDWKDLGGRTVLLETISEAFSILMNVITPIKTAFRDVFPAVTGQRLFAITEGLQALVKNFKIGYKSMKNIRLTFTGLFSVIKLVGDGISFLLGLIMPGSKTVGNLAESFFALTGAMGQGLINLTTWIRNSKELKAAVENVSNFIQFLRDNVMNFVKEINRNYRFPTLEEHAQFFDNVRLKAEGFMQAVQLAGEAIGGGFSVGVENANENLARMLDFIRNIKSGISNFGNKIKEALGPVTGEIQEAFSKVTITDVIGTGMLGGIAAMVWKVLKNAGELTESVVDILQRVEGVLVAYQNNLNSKTLINIAIAVGILAASLIALTFVDPDRLVPGLIGVSVLLAEVVATLKILEKMNFKDLVSASAAVFIISGAIFMLAMAMSQLSDFQDWDSTWPALVSMIALMGGLVIAIKQLGKLQLNGKEFIITSIGILVFATAVGRMAKAVKAFADLSPEELLKGITALGVVLGEIALFMRVSGVKDMRTQAGTITAVAVSLLALYLSVNLFGNMDLGVLQQGMMVIGGLMLMLATMMRVIGNLNIAGVAASITAVALAMLILYKPIEMFGQMDAKTLTQGLLTFVTILAGLTAALMALGTMDAAGINFTAIGAALVGMAVALYIIAAAMTMLSKLGWEGIAIGLVGILVPLAALTGAALLLAPIAPALIVLSLAILALGAAGALAGWGLLKLAAGLAALALVTTVQVAAIVASFGIFAIGMAKIIPQALAAFAQGLALVSPSLSRSLEVILLNLLGTIQRVTPAIVETFFILITELLNVIAKRIPDFIEAGVNLVVAIITGLAEQIPVLIEAGFTLIISFLEGLAEAMDKNSDILAEAIHKLIESALELIVKILLGGILAVYDAGKDLMDSGFLEGVKSMFEEIVTAIGELPGKAIKALGGWIGGFFEAGADLVQGFVDGMEGSQYKVNEAAEETAQGALNATNRKLGVESPSKEFMKIGRYSALGLAKGLDKYSKLVAKSAEGVGDKAKSGLEKTMSHLTDILENDADMNPTLRPVVDMGAVEKGIDDTFSRQLGLNLTESTRVASTANRRVGGALTAATETVISKQEVHVSHDGRIRVEGVTNEGQVVAVKDLLIEEIRNGDRRLPNRTSIYPFG